jgi:N-acetylmuramoyl-L-alanine amidase
LSPLIAAPSPNHDVRPGPVDHLVLHYTGMVSAEAALARLCDSESRVSAHYLVDEDGTTYALVDEARRAWHAGVSYWRGITALNDRSVGTEIVNPGHEHGYRAFPPAQMAAVAGLCRAILGRHRIPARNVVAHSDVAPDRKQDPGELFPWAWLAEQDVGLWNDDPGAPGDLMADLAAIGYDVSLPEGLVITAFQRRFSPHCLDGVADAPTSARAAAIRKLFDETASKAGSAQAKV